MIYDSSKLEQGEIIYSDICVVGAGVAGMTIAKEFKNTKHSVVLLESGKEKPENEYQSVSKGSNIGHDYYDLDKARTRAVGGSSHQWHVELNYDEQLGVRLRPLDKIDFEKRDWIPYSGWPITKNDLDPYYERAQEVFDIGPYRYDSTFWAEQIKDQELIYNEGNINTVIFQFAKEDIFHSKHRKDLKEVKNIHIYIDATVLKVQINEYANSTNSVLVRTLGGKTFTVNSRYFILANGGLEVPRLMLLSKDVIPAGVGNQNDLVGRFFMEHPHLKGAMFYPRKADIFDNHGFYEVHQNNKTSIMGNLALDEKVLRKERLLNNTVSLHHEPMAALYKTESEIRELSKKVSEGVINKELFGGLKTVLKNSDLISYVALRKLLRGDKNKWYDRKFKYHGLLLRMECEQAPDPESRVTLGNTLDQFGQNEIELNWKLKKTDLNEIKRYLYNLDKELRRNKLGKLDVLVKENVIPKDLHGGFHHMGTTRMASNPKNGVVDRDCRVHGVNNLYVAGSSVFPTVGYANPSLTIVALSIRISDKLKQLL